MKIMTEVRFIEILDSLEEQHKKDLQVVNAASIIFPDAFEANLFPDNHVLEKLLIKILKEEFNDDHKESWIEYYIYELGYGAPEGKSVITRKDGTNVPMHTSKDLYNWLVELKTT